MRKEPSSLEENRRPLRPPNKFSFGRKEISGYVDFTREIAGRMDLESILDLAAEKIPSLSGADASVLYLFTETGDRLEPAKKFGLGQAGWIPLSPTEGVAGLTLRERKAVLVPQISNGHSLLRGNVKKEGFTWAMSLPLHTREAGIGILLLLGRKVRPFGPGANLLPQALADQTAMAISKARCYEEARKQVEEISHLRENERKSKDFLENIVDRSLDAILVTDLEGRFTFVNRGGEEMLGLSSKELIGKKISDFYLGGKKEAEKVRKTLVQNERLRNYETGFISKGGKAVSVILSASLLRDAQGKLTGILAVGKDVTEYKKLLNHVDQTERRYQKLFQAVNDAIFSLNREGYFATFNHMFLKMTGYSEKEIRSFHFSRIFRPEDLPFMKHQRKEVRGGYPERYTFRIKNREGKIIYVEGNFRRLLEKSEVAGILGVLRDVTEKIKLERELLELSITDGLTGLHNQRHFYSELEKEMERARRQHTTLALLLFDLDEFKAYNDRHGHLEGDKVLKSVAEAVLKSIRKMDSAYRYGGDEFTIILPGAGKEEAGQVAQRVRRTFRLIPALKHISLSIGLVEFDPASDLTTFVKHADDAMYAAKKAGGDRVNIFA